MNFNKILRITWLALALVLVISGIITGNEVQSYSGAIIAAMSVFTSQERK